MTKKILSLRLLDRNRLRSGTPQLRLVSRHGCTFRPLCHLLAPNFGKTAGFLKSPTLAGGYGGAKGFSEIGRQGVANSLELTSMIPAGTWRDHFVHQRMALATKTSVRAFFSTKCPTLVWQPKGAKGLSELSASQLKKIGEFMQDKNLLLLMSGSHL